MKAKFIVFILFVFCGISIFAQGEKAQVKRGEQIFLQANAARDAEEYEKAFELYRKAANLGHAEACFELSSCYRNGIGVGQDIPKSMELLKLAAQKDSVSALLTLGMWYDGGFELYGVPDDPTMAKKYLERVLQLDYASDGAKELANKLLKKAND